MSDKYNFLNFTVIDFETTGLDPKIDQIIEACVVRVRDGEVVSVFNTLVRLREGVPLTKKITEMTGHTVDDLFGGITEQQLAEMLWAMIGENEMIVAYNALFDMSFLDGLYGSTIDQDYILPNPFLDPLTITRDRQPFPHKLGDVCKRMGIELDDAHSAWADTHALLDVVLALHKEKDISEWVNVAGYRAKYGEPSWYPPHAILKKQGAEVIEHSKPKPLPKARPTQIISAQNKRKKRVPDDPKEFDREKMPKGFIRKALMVAVDAYLSKPKGECRIKPIDEDELKGLLCYLSEIKGIPMESIVMDDETVCFALEWEYSSETQGDGMHNNYTGFYKQLITAVSNEPVGAQIRISYDEFSKHE